MDNWEDIQEILKSSGPDVKQYDSAQSYSYKMGKENQNGTTFEILIFTNFYKQNVVLCHGRIDGVLLENKI